MLKFALFSLTAALVCAQVPRVMTREGPYFVGTTVATADGRAPVQLRIVSRGNIIVRGSNSDRVVYKLVQKVRAHSEEEANVLFGQLNTAIELLPGRTTLSVLPLSNAAVSNDLEVSVPRLVVQSIVQTTSGSVEAYDLEGSVQILSALGVRCDRIHGNVSGGSKSGEIRLGKIGGSVKCSSGGGSIFIESVGGEGICETAGGEIIVNEAGGPLTLNNVSGNIEVDHAASTVEAHTGEGVIKVNQAGGQVVADTRGGSIEIGGARGVRCESAAGAVRVKNVSGPLNIQAVMGSILADLIGGMRIDDSQLTAGAGDVTVLIPSRLALSVMARNDSGTNPRIQSDFPEFRTKSFGFNHPPTLAEGQINGGGPVLRINVASGIIYLKKLKQ
jgi:DUF4097 and DUF4098 domain-containing protein YvlB